MDLSYDGLPIIEATAAISGRLALPADDPLLGRIRLGDRARLVVDVEGGAVAHQVFETADDTSAVRVIRSARVLRVVSAD